MIWVDNGPDLSAKSRAFWAFMKGVAFDFSRSGKPIDNALIEVFDGRFRAECLNAHRFPSIEDARGKVEDCRRPCNEERPQGTIGHKAPIALSREGATGPLS
jgi:putative transposase